MYQNVIKKMISSTQREDITNVKSGSFCYVEQVNDGEAFRMGAVISSCVKFEVYEDTPSLSVGQRVFYYQKHNYSPQFVELETPSEYLINAFQVTEIKRLKKTVQYICYDDTYVLDKDISEQLSSLNDAGTFVNGITYALLLNYIVTFCGGGIQFDTSTFPWAGASYNPTVNYFYYNGITGRDVISKIAELSGCYVRAEATVSGVSIRRRLVFARYNYTTGYYDKYATGSYPWLRSDYYIVCPTDQQVYYGTGDYSQTQLIPIWYKENGLEINGDPCAVLNRLNIFDTNGIPIYDTDTDSGISLPSGDNVYTIYGNYIAERTQRTTGIKQLFRQTAETISNILNDGVIPLEVRLFPFRNPYRVGDPIENIADTQNNRFRSVVMEMEITDAEVILTCFGEEKYNGADGGDSLANKSIFIQPDDVIAITPGITTIKTISGLTADSVLIRWNFYTDSTGTDIIAENAFLQDMEWTTAANACQLKTTGENVVYCRPVFANPTIISDGEAVAGAVVFQTSAIITVPVGSTGITKIVSGITNGYNLIRWNFYTDSSGSEVIAENAHSQDMEWETNDGTFTLKTGGSSPVYCQPVFARPTIIAS